nr:immunoglobulin light chain junction region [Macaca mulatta]
CHQHGHWPQLTF